LAAYPQGDAYKKKGNATLHGGMELNERLSTKNIEKEQNLFEFFQNRNPIVHFFWHTIDGDCRTSEKVQTGSCKIGCFVWFAFLCV